MVISSVFTMMVVGMELALRVFMVALIVSTVAAMVLSTKVLLVVADVAAKLLSYTPSK